MLTVTPTYNYNYHVNWHPWLILYTSALSDNTHIHLKALLNIAEETLYEKIKVFIVLPRAFPHHLVPEGTATNNLCPYPYEQS